MHNFIGAYIYLNIYAYCLEKKIQCCDLEILTSVLPWSYSDFFVLQDVAYLV